MAAHVSVQGQLHGLQPLGAHSTNETTVDGMLLRSAMQEAEVAVTDPDTGGMPGTVLTSSYGSAARCVSYY